MQRKVPPLRWRQRASAAMFGFIVSLLFPAAAQDHGLVVSDAWIREAPPGVSMLAGYFNVANHGSAPMTLVGARSPRFGSVEMHVTSIADGVARMRPLERVELGPGEAVAFEPGGRHLMLMQPAGPTAAGDCVVVTLLLEEGGELDVRFEVRRR